MNNKEFVKSMTKILLYEVNVIRFSKIDTSDEIIAIDKKIKELLHFNVVALFTD